jgi:hypothetical protein
LNNSNINPGQDFVFGVSWDGTNAIFTGTPNTDSGFSDYYAPGGRTAVFDVTLSSSTAPEIPEPSTYALMGAGLLSLLAFRRRVAR